MAVLTELRTAPRSGTSRQTQRAWAWGGVASIVLFAIGWVALMRFLPPLAPSKSAVQIARTFRDHATAIRFGALLMMCGTMLWVPWAAVVAAQTRRTEGERPVLTWIQLASAAVGVAVILLGEIFWIVAAFRPTRSPNLVLLLSDMGFITEILPFMIFVVWNIALAMAIFTDDSEAPAYPRWAGYLCVWLAVLYLPGGALAFFHHGPFGWNGLMAFFVPAGAFFAWIVVMTVLALQAIGRQLSATPLRARG
jgi:hypothetical protein